MWVYSIVKSLITTLKNCICFAAAERNSRKAREIERNQKTNRLSLLDMEMEQSKNAPSIASPAAFGYGPALTMPTLMGMMPDMPPLDQSGEGPNLDSSLISASSFSPERTQPGNVRDSVALDMSNFGSGQMPTSIANIFQGGEQEIDRGEVMPQQRKQGMMCIYHQSACCRNGTLTPNLWVYINV